MSNYIEYNDRIAFHPGYYIKEIVDESGLTQADFAKRLDTTPKNLSLLVRGEQNLSIDIAVKLSRMVGTDLSYWLNLQKAYDTLIGEFKSEKELEKERLIMKKIDYKYFRDNFGLPDLSRKIDEQIRALRNFLKVSTLGILVKRDMAVNFRSTTGKLTEANIIKANTMVQIATNKVLNVEIPQYNKKRFDQAVEYALTLTKNHEEFYPLLAQKFREAGVAFVILPNFPGSKINGATKKVGNSIMLMVNDRKLYADTFWFTLFHEIGHIVNGDYGISFDSETGEKEELADRFAENKLIPKEEYQKFIERGEYDINSIKDFAEEINRAPGIILGRLQNDGYIRHDDWTMKSLRCKYRVKQR